MRCILRGFTPAYPLPTNMHWHTWPRGIWWHGTVRGRGFKSLTECTHPWLWKNADCEAGEWGWDAGGGCCGMSLIPPEGSDQATHIWTIQLQSAHTHPVGKIRSDIPQCTATRAGVGLGREKVFGSWPWWDDGMDRHDDAAVWTGRLWVLCVQWVCLCERLGVGYFWTVEGNNGF